MVCFTPRWGFFSPFPHGTVSLSVTQEYLVLRGGPRGFTRDFTCPMLLGIQYKRDKFLVTGLSPSMVQFSIASPNFFRLGTLSHNPGEASLSGLDCSPFARRYLGNRFCFLFLWLLRCFNSPGCLFPIYEFNRKYKGLPYSGISGSKLLFSSPKRFVG